MPTSAFAGSLSLTWQPHDTSHTCLRLEIFMRPQPDAVSKEAHEKMAAHANKRRKVDHVSSEDEDAASFASFGDDDRPDRPFEDEDLDELDGGNDGVDEGSAENGESEEQEEDEEEQEVAIGHETKSGDSRRGGDREQQRWPSNDIPGKTKPITTTSTSGRFVRSTSYATATFKSSLFKLQVDELLEQIRPKHGKREAQAEAALHQIKRAIEGVEGKPALPVSDAERELLKTSGVKIPFPDPRPPSTAQYKLGFPKPANINVVGSYALKTATRAHKTTEIDMVVVMPSPLFQEKDYLNHRYFYKRAYYLACMAAGVKVHRLDQYQLHFSYLHGNLLLPILVVTPRSEMKDGVASKVPSWQINVMPCSPEGTFNADKMLPNKNCVRHQDIENLNGHATIATPFYNSSLRQDMLVVPYLRLLSNAAKTCDAYRDAYLLSNTWARQRGLGSAISSGGFGGFEFSAVMALLLQGGGPSGRPILSDRYSSYQLFKATLQILATKDLSKQSLVVGEGSAEAPTSNNGCPVLWDGDRSHNLLYKMTRWSYRQLRYEARTTLEMLADSTFDAFDATFIHRKDIALYNFDFVVQMEYDVLRNCASRQAYESPEVCRKLYDSLQRGLGDRAGQIHILAPNHERWDLESSNIDDTRKAGLLIGIIVDPASANRLVDHGPSAEQKRFVADFRTFWGEKAELRRFKDGSIVETLVWSSVKDSPPVMEQIVRYVVQRHISSAAEQSTKFVGPACTHLLHTGTNSGSFDSTVAAFRQLEDDIRGLGDLPLSVRQISRADPQLRCTSTNVKPRPADIVLQFEGSARWPDDLVAIQRTKIAFLLKLREQLSESVRGLSARIGLENESEDILNQAFLDVTYDSGPAFRIRIYHDREQTLLQRMLKDPSSSPSAKDGAAYSLAKYKRDYVINPWHTQAFAALCGRHPALSGTVRLVKFWFASHLLSNQVPEELIELIVARAFVQPWPWQTPSSIETGFYRTISWLSRWDWKHEPLIVDLSGGDLNQQQMQQIITNFEAWRKIDPALNRLVLFAASNVDHSGSTWTDNRPQRVVAGHMTALAKAARQEIEAKQLELDPSALFVSSLVDFDFVLHLAPELVGTESHRRFSKKQTAFKNLEINLEDDESTIGFDPLLEFTNELEHIFGSAVVFFSGGEERPCIAGLWNPQTATRAWTLNLSYSTMPVKQAATEKVQAQINKEAILVEISALGGDMIRKIDVHR